MISILKKISVILMDVDGVLTDGKIIFSSSGEELKMFDIQDGMGIAMAHRAGFKTGIITSRTSSMVKRRARELKINYVSQGTEKKLEAYEICLNQLKINDEDVCYIGDDLLDIPVLKRVGFSVAVANSRDELKEFCNYVTEHKGGGGAVREVIEKILKAQGKFTEVLQQIIQ